MICVFIHTFDARHDSTLLNSRGLFKSGGGRREGRKRGGREQGRGGSSEGEEREGGEGRKEGGWEGK